MRADTEQPARRGPRLLVVGDLNLDIVVSGPKPRWAGKETFIDRVECSLGGSAALVCSGASKLGITTSLVATLGSDDLGTRLLQLLEATGCDCSYVRRVSDTQTGKSVILSCEGDKAILTDLGPIGDLEATDIPEDLLSTASHLHVASWFLLKGLQPELPQVILAAKTKGLSVSLDPNWDPQGKFSSAPWKQLAPDDVLFVNQAESTALSGKKNPIEAAKILGGSGCTVVVKLGPRGAIAFQQGTILKVTPEELFKTVPTPLEVADTVGAGDAFAAAYLAFRLAGEGAAECLRAGVAAGTLSTRALGGERGQPTLEEVRELFGH